MRFETGFRRDVPRSFVCCRKGMALLLMLFFSGTVAQAVTPLVVYDFEGNVTDSSGNGNHGVLTGTYSFNADGYNGKAVSLSGNAHIKLPDNLILNNQDFTVAMWFKSTSPGALFGYQNSSVGGRPNQYVPIVSINNQGQLRVEIWQTGGGLTYTSTALVNDDNWHRVVLTSSTTNGEIKVYLDGSLLVTRGGTPEHLAMSYNQIGVSYHDGSVLRPNLPSGWDYFTGLIDEFLFFSEALPQTEIAKTTQSISFPVIADRLLGQGTLDLAATASSGLSVSYTSATPEVCTVLANTVTLVANGTCTIRANQAGDAVYSAAAQVTRSFEVTDTAAPVLTISGGNTIFVEDDAAVAVDPLLTIAGSNTGIVDGATVAITGGYISSEDRLVYTTTRGIGGSFNAASGILTLTGSASPDDYQAALRAVQYQNINSENPDTAARTIRYALGSSLSFSGNGHFYEFVTAAGISWTAARDAAAARTLFGMQGYLTTVTSAGENSFVVSKLVGQGWMGASDAVVEGDWRWVTGPEAGTPFWNDAGAGSPVGGEYNNWSSGEPNDWGSGEDYAHFLSGGAWNDFPLSLGSIAGYVVEYGGMPGDPVLQITGNKIINVSTQNDPPTGTVTISGSPAEGQTLTVSNTLTDVEGLGAISYQWNRTGNPIDGATNSSYMLTQSDVGEIITVTASYTDNGGTAESVTSNATAAVINVNDPPTGSVAISGDLTEGQTLTASNTLADVDGLGTISYQWYRAGSAIDGATNDTYVLTQWDVGQTLTVTAGYLDGQGSAESITSNVTAVVANVNDLPVGSVTISGTPTEGQTLTAGNTLADVDGLGVISYQWNRAGNAISGATGSSYTLGSADVGQSVSVTASYTDGFGTVEEMTSSAVVIANLNYSPTGSVSIRGVQLQGHTLTADVSTVSDADGLGAFSYQWQRGGTDISGATSSSYVLGAADVDHMLTVTIRYTDDDGTAESVTSAATGIIDGDLDGDGTGDRSDADIDGDGMSNTYEDANGLDKYDNSDRDGDADNDGISNYDESVAGSNANADDYPPVITAPPDIFVDATGLFTEVALGTASALDSLDGSVAVTLTHLNDEVVTTLPTHFRPGVHTAIWTASDAAGNRATAVQTIHVTPLAEFSKNQISSEGSVVRFKVILNGPPVSYPVTVPYTVGGTADTDGSDHDLVDGSITINSPDLEATVTVTLVDDGAGEGSETLLVTMGTPTNAVAGHVASHHIEIVEGNVAPVVFLSADQGRGITRIVGQGDGNVVVTAAVTDANAGDSFSFDWSATDSTLVDTDSSDATFEFEPANLAPGIYTVAVSISDGVERVSSEVKLNVVAEPPSIDTGDSDGDGISDDTEGYGDSDGDGVPDFLDHAGIARNVVQEQVTTETRFLMETEPGLELNLGAVAFGSGGEKIAVMEKEIQELANDGAGAVTDEEHVFNNGLFDFIVDKLPVAGQSVDIVIAQFAPIPADAVYRKLMPGGWQTFIEDNKNSVNSAAGTEGYCPPPNSAAYTVGLTEGHWCVQLTIEDGGPNDADGMVNHSVNDPGGVAVVTAAGAEDQPLRTGVNGMGGCSLDSGNRTAIDPVLPLLLILSLLYLVRGKTRIFGVERRGNQ